MSRSSTITSKPLLATLFLLDSSKTMAESCLSDSSSKFSAAKQAILSWFSERRAQKDAALAAVLLFHTSPSDKESSPSSSFQSLCPNLVNPNESSRLISRMLFAEPSSRNESDFCEALVHSTTTILTQSNTPCRIVLLTDAESTIRMDSKQILETLDRLREIKCRLEVVGLDFLSSSAVYHEPAEAHSSQEGGNSRVETMNDDDESSVESDDSQPKENYFEDRFFVYDSKKDREALLHSLAEKTGGSVTAASNVQQVLAAVKHVTANHFSTRQSNVIDLTVSPAAPSPSKRTRTTQKEDQWICSSCCYENDPTATLCSICEDCRYTDNDVESSSSGRSDSNSPGKSDGDWACPHCAFVNLDSRAICICNRTKSDGNNKQDTRAFRAAVESCAKDGNPSGLAERSLQGSSRYRRRELRRTNSAMRIVWGGPEDSSFDEWLDATKPSELSKTDCAWIQLNNINPTSPGFESSEDWTRSESGTATSAAYTTALDKISTKIQADEAVGKQSRISQAMKDACLMSLVQTATALGDTGGKWLVFLRPDQADCIWEKIARATADGRLGCSAKIAPVGGLVDGGSKTVCCVYVKDFNNRSEVKRVLRVLIDDLQIFVSSFKPDFMTGLGIEGKNKWRLSPRLYTVKEVLQWQ